MFILPLTEVRNGMKNSMFLGLALGMVAGACLASNSQKTRQMVSGAQEQIKSKLCPQDNEQQNCENCQNEQNY